ncbi:M24 family metallopeptidase [Verminephrobacter eiseniae]|uniref:Peptidase M24 n=1 Tax=Verminephrobacter eiseniae (strain EF01-2) TaxID=391735 RepID=A1WLZ5_VEREI|nr:Xaa-Pro peptidase family protein [Verminephrobacter eiseniae]ABM58652.1 peptidase M24 [Verminephrobacter eiseniae EF01-2]MCW5284224.1 aminopeptidase P family protein [Verminephrobacter eiseniae]MCW5301931.1 aminopeptidase P family protein [Verminephrobacter eiseniae]MCW8178912.1 aminopeptidase P family protein [Verminephrobacter eiseniae]MCW8191395.1 aminopeptidase P family protein [Verminephrobacter eiseniae]
MSIVAFDPSGGMWLSDTEPSFIDVDALRQGRLARLRAWMKQSDYGAVVLFDPYNQRYATGSRNMFGYFLRNSTRYFFIPAEGAIVLFEYPQSQHVSMALDTIAQARPSKLVWSAVSGKDDETAGPFADEIADLLRQHGGGSMRLGLDRCSHLQALALTRRGCEVRDCQGEILAVRAIKTQEEIKCLQVSMAGAEAAVAAVRAAIEPGVSENDLFAIMYHEVIRQGGEFIETRLLTSGQRTNPWFNEAGGRKIRPGELIALDTDTIGCYGYYSDFSRTFRCGPGKPTAEQKLLYRMAHDQVQHNIAIVQPGMAFREVAEKAWKIPERFVEQRYTSVMHGVGMHGETPFIAHAMDYQTYGCDGHLVPGMVLSVESYIGAKGGREGVKLEDEILITETGTELLSRFPYEDDFLSGGPG